MARTAERAEVLAALEAGAVVGIPTDTVYGFACRAEHVQACQAVFELKGRPPDLALPVLVASRAQARTLVVDHSAAYDALSALWPGALTIVTTRAPALGYRLGGDEESIGLRWPDDELACSLIEAAGPLAVTSANTHGAPPARSAEELDACFPELLILEGGAGGGVPSSVVSLCGAAPVLVREGALSHAELDALLTRVGSRLAPKNAEQAR